MILCDQIKVVLFDLGDTLIYFDGDWNDVLIRSTKALWTSLADSEIRVEPDSFLNDFSQRMRLYYQDRVESYIEYRTANVLADTLAQYGFKQIPQAIITEALSQMYAISQAHWKLESDAILTLEWLKQHNYRLGLISNASDSEDVFTLLKQHGIDSFFENIIISANFGVRKPHPSIFKSALEYFSVKPEQALMVGDKLTMDILGANNLGIFSVWINRRSKNEQTSATHQIQPTIEISALKDLIPFLDKNNKIKSV